MEAVLPVDLVMHSPAQHTTAQAMILLFSGQNKNPILLLIQNIFLTLSFLVIFLNLVVSY